MFGTARKQRFPGGLVIAAASLWLLAACATSPGDELQSANQPQLCADGSTPSCIEKIGKPTRCFCADRDELRELLDPHDPFRR